MTGFFAIKAVDDGGAVMWTGTSGVKSVLLFSSQEAAELFVSCQCSIVQLRVVELTTVTIQSWLKKVRRMGTRSVILNPSADSNNRGDSLDLDDVVTAILGR
jgi:pyocin large subunit-like protein